MSAGDYRGGSIPAMIRFRAPSDNLSSTIEALDWRPATLPTTTGFIINNLLFFVLCLNVIELLQNSLVHARLERTSPGEAIEELSCLFHCFTYCLIRGFFGSFRGRFCLICNLHRVEEAGQ
jgi:hypothetical protein